MPLDLFPGVTLRLSWRTLRFLPLVYRKERKARRKALQRNLHQYLKKNSLVHARVLRPHSLDGHCIALSQTQHIVFPLRFERVHVSFS